MCSHRLVVLSTKVERKVFQIRNSIDTNNCIDETWKVTALHDRGHKATNSKGRVATPEGPESLHLLRGCNVSVGEIDFQIPRNNFFNFELAVL
jgi:hypothetical protein